MPALPGLAIHVLEGGRLVRAESSRAFPGWRAEEIHRALNEHEMSEVTREALHRVGAALGGVEGTGSDDDPWLRHYRDESRAAGRAEARYETVLTILEERGITLSPTLRARLAALGALPAEAAVRAALRCTSESEFLELYAAEARKKRGGGD